MSKKWTSKEIEAHIEINLSGDYSATVVISALYKKIYGKYPKIGLSGFQVEAIECLLKVLPDKIN
jgi:hypothetical protein